MNTEHYSDRSVIVKKNKSNNKTVGWMEPPTGFHMKSNLGGWRISIDHSCQDPETLWFILYSVYSGNQLFVKIFENRNRGGVFI